MNASPGLLLGLVDIVGESPCFPIKNKPSLVPIVESTPELQEESLGDSRRERELGTEGELVSGGLNVAPEVKLVFIPPYRKVASQWPIIL